MNEEGQQSIEQSADANATGAPAANGQAQDQNERMVPAWRVEQIVKERLARAKLDARQQSPQAKTQDQPQSAAPASNTQAVDALAILQFRDTLEEIAEQDGIKIPTSARKRMQEAYTAMRPADAGTWAREWIRDFGLASKTEAQPAPNQQTNQPPQQTQEARPLVSNAVAPSPATYVDPGDARPAWRYSSEDIARMSDKYGPRQAAAKIRDKWQQDLRATRVVTPLRK